MKNPVEIINNRFNLDEIKLILKEEVKLLLKDKFFKKGEEKSSINNISKKVIKINILIIQILILIFLNSLVTELKTNLTPLLMTNKYRLYCIKIFLSISNDDISIILFMALTSNENWILFCVYKTLKNIQLITFKKIKEFFHEDEKFGFYFIRYLIEQKISLYFRRYWIQIISLCNTVYVWKFPDINQKVVAIIFVVIMDFLWAICNYMLHTIYLNKEFSFKELFSSVFMSLVFTIVYICSI